MYIYSNTSAIFWSRGPTAELPIRIDSSGGYKHYPSLQYPSFTYMIIYFFNFFTMNAINQYHNEIERYN